MPLKKHNILYKKAARTWDEALPLGNGLLGALLWGKAKAINISLDRTDLWDSRVIEEFQREEYDYNTLCSWVDQKRSKEEQELYEKPYERPAPTKIPAGRITLRLPKAKFSEAELNIQDGEGEIRLRNGSGVKVWVHAEKPVGIIEIKGTVPKNISLKAPAFSGRKRFLSYFQRGVDAGAVSGLGYNAPLQKSGKGWMSYEQDCREDWSYAVYLEGRESKDGWLGAWSIARSQECDSPLQTARNTVQEVLNAELSNEKEEHRQWWDKYWSMSDLKIDHEKIEKQYFLEMYKFGAAGRKGHPPIALQGPWTADNGKLPPWKGDYHHDLNTQLTYWPAFTGNRLEQGRVLIDWLWETRDNCREWTQRFFKKPGLNVPMSADIFNRQIGGWRQYTHSATTSCWLSQHFYLHWQFSQDREFLKERAYPYMKEAAEFIKAMTENCRQDGYRTLPLSASPEMNDNRHEAWLPSLSNYDLHLMRFLFIALSDLAEELNLPEEKQEWLTILSEFQDSIKDENGKMLICKDFPLPGSHRHFSHLIGIHPLGIIDTEQSPEIKQSILASLDELHTLGPHYWTGYSYAWLANLEARAGRGEKAAKALEIFAKAFVLKSSFHCNGDTTKSGYSKLWMKPFTLEGNFAFAAGLQEMLLQSHRGYIELFPAVPKEWKDVSFHRLRARGAVLVSAKRDSEGEVTEFELYSDRDCSCTVLSPFTNTKELFELKATVPTRVRRKQ